MLNWIRLKIEENLNTGQEQYLIPAMGLIMLLLLVIMLHSIFFVVYTIDGTFEMSFMNFSGAFLCGVSIYIILYKKNIITAIYIFIFSIVYYILYLSYFFGHEKNAIIILPIIVVGISSIYQLNKKHILIASIILFVTYFISLYFQYTVTPKYKDRYEYIAIVNALISLSCSIFVLYTKHFSNFYLKKFNDQRIKTLSTEANKDFLTGLWNRRYVVSELEYRNIDNNYSIIIADIDWFKKINDKYGHSAGDFILIDISKIFTSYFEKNSIISRWGGEEFVFILHDVNKEHLSKITKKLLLDISNTPFIYNEQTIWLTVSLGIKIITDATNFDTAIKQADEALYFSKNNGRNQVVFYDDIQHDCPSCTLSNTCVYYKKGSNCSKEVKNIS